MTLSLENRFPPAWTPAGRRSLARGWALGGALLALLLAMAYGFRLAGDPAVALLVPEAGAEWILRDEPYLLSRRKPGEFTATFSALLEAPALEARKEPLTLTLRAFRACRIRVDGGELALPSAARAHSAWNWKEPLTLDLGRHLSPGPHRLEVEVRNQNGPPALLAHCAALGLRTGPDWEAAGAGGSWSPVELARALRQPAIAGQFPGAAAALGRELPLLLAVFLAVVLGTLWWTRSGSRPLWLERAAPTPSRVRWALLWAWGLLAANNILKLPEVVGFDARAHLDYIAHVAETGRIPLASEGWQMFQSPLYYLVSAPLYWLSMQILGPITLGAQLLRIVPLACGAAQVQISFVSLKAVFPGRPDLQALGTIVGGLLPMNLYLSQAIGNEPLAGALAGAALTGTFLLAARPGRDGSSRLLLAIGVFLGLALLAKATAVLLVLPLLGFTAFTLRSGGASWRRTAAGALLILGSASTVGGWYYLMNWMALGTPFVAGWDPARGIAWWQHPGFRTPEQVLRFGEALSHPIYAACSGFLDALYSTFWADGYLSGIILFEHRPPWNYGWMLSSVLLALLPSAAILLGGAAALGGKPRTGRRPALVLAAVCAGIYLAALLHLFLSLPIYSTVKASYMSGLAGSFAVLAAGGFDLLTRWRLARAAVHGIVACWALGAYLGCFIL